MLKPYLLLLLMLGLSFQAQANYWIEMIVFESTKMQPWLDEHYPLLPAKIDTHEKTYVLGSSTSGNRHLANETQLTLKDAAKKLVNSGEYRIVAHTGWTQPAEERYQAGFTQLPEGMSQTGNTLQAQIKFYKQKFEHIDVEAQLERNIPKSVQEAFALKHQVAMADVSEKWRFRLQESRKIKLGELNYFDHPMFGIIIKIHGPDQ